MNQRIDGNGNIQAGGDVHFHGQPTFDPSNPNLMRCPACLLPVSITANECPFCADDLAYRRRMEWEKARRSRAWKMIGFLVAVAIGSYQAGQLFQAIQPHATIAAVIAGLLAAGVANQI